MRRTSLLIALSVSALAAGPLTSDPGELPRWRQSSARGQPGLWHLAGGFGADTTVPAWCRQLPRSTYDTLPLVLTSRHGWFEVYRIRPGVHAIYEPHQFQEVISYLIEGRQRALLLDTGMGIAPIRPVVERITDRPVTVLNTHTHPDHVGGNHEFDHILAMDTRYTRRHARRGFSHREMRSQVSSDALCRDLPPGADSASYRIRPFSIHGTVSDGDSIHLGGRSLEVVHTPGHTPDALAVLDRDDGLLFTGDTFYRGPIYLFAEETDLQQYVESVDRLLQFLPDIELLLPGHNTPVARPGKLRALRRAIRVVRSGDAEGRQVDGRMEYSFDGFSLLLAAEPGG